jgi:hypothetical protein
MTGIVHARARPTAIMEGTIIIGGATAIITGDIGDRLPGRQAGTEAGIGGIAIGENIGRMIGGMIGGAAVGAIKWAKGVRYEDSAPCH